MNPLDIPWSHWVSLDGCWRGQTIPAHPGLYRIRRVGLSGLDYIGQTGSGTMTLRKRLAMLKGIFGVEMPYRDPHTAGPALWALLHSTAQAFEVSVAPIEGETPFRRGVEVLALAQYRQEHGCSPTVNFGRMPSRYRMSSPNNATVVATGSRFRGGTGAHVDPSHEPSLGPVGAFTGSPRDGTWCGHTWSPWTAVNEAISGPQAGATGLYRLALGASEQTDLVYIGQGLIAARLTAHLDKARSAEHRQAQFFGNRNLVCSWVVNPTWLTHQRLELENDLIAAHLLVTGKVPSAQFLG